MIEKIKNNALFKDMSVDEINRCIICSNAQIKTYDKNQIIFSETDQPKSVYILITGCVAVCKNSVDGKTYRITNINENDMFGEVYVFLSDTQYHHYAMATQPSQVLQIPKEFFFHTCAKACGQHFIIIQNMLCVLAIKAYYLNNKVQLLTSGSLRQKIAKYLVENCNDEKYIKLGMNREQFSDYLNVTRPSLSRELINMQNDLLIEVDRDMVKILDLKALTKYLS